MAQYKVNEITKAKLYQSAARLLYEDGYDETTIERISKNSGMSKGIVRYHFGSKPALAASIEWAAEKKIRDNVEKYFLNNYPDLAGSSVLVTSVASRVIFRLYCEDPKAARFYRDTYVNSIECQSPHEQEIWTRFLEENPNKIEGAIDAQLLFAAARGACASYIIRYMSGNLSVDRVLAEDFRVMLPLRELHFPGDMIQNIVEKSRTICDSMKLEFYPMIEVRIS